MFFSMHFTVPVGIYINIACDNVIFNSSTYVK